MLSLPSGPASGQAFEVLPRSAWAGDLPFGPVPMALGVLYDDPRPTFEGAVLEQNAKASEGKDTNLAHLLAKGQTWTVGGTAADPRADVAVVVQRAARAVAEGERSWLARSLGLTASIRAGSDDPPIQLLHLDDLQIELEGASTPAETSVPARPATPPAGPRPPR